MKRILLAALVLLLAATACSRRSPELYTIRNASGMEVSITDFGGRIVSLLAPDRDGNFRDVVLGFDNLEDYYPERNQTDFGASIGRYANRIKNSRFTLNGKEYILEPNDGPNHLHGVLSRRIFDAEVSGDELRFSYTNPDGEDDLPGEVRITVTYSLNDDNELTMRYEASSDQDTIINLTNHSYFNLAGHDSGSIDDQLLMISADSFLETSGDCCPTGRVLPAEGVMDFRALCRIGDGFSEPCRQMDLVGGYDHCYVLRGDDGTNAQAYCPGTGILLSVSTTQPSLQFYSGNYLDQISSPGKNCAKYTRRSGFALETQHYPCSPNFPEFPTTVLRAGEVYREHTTLAIHTK